MTGQDDHERTMAFAEIAFGQIKALRQPASPRHFEIWYTYATGYSPSLNQMINDTLTRNGTLGDADFEALPIKPEVRPKILKGNAARLLGLTDQPPAAPIVKAQPEK